MRTTPLFRRHMLIAALALCSLALTYAAHAQASSDSELRESVRAAILADPRSAQMSEADVDSMVAALAGEAEAQGVTSEDIAWRPQDTPGEPASTCGFLCALNEAFGFDGSDLAIPVGLGVSSPLLLFLTGSILLHRHGHHPMAGPIGTPVSKSSSEMTYGP